MGPLSAIRGGRRSADAAGLLLAAILLVAQSGATASPLVAYEWRDISFTAASGTRVEASVDEHDTLSRLRVVKHGKVFSATESLLGRITDTSLSDLRIFEEPGTELVLVELKVRSFDADTGNETGTGTWTLRIVAGELRSASFTRQPGKEQGIRDR